MPGMIGKVFVDTNIWIYAHLLSQNTKKFDIANRVLSSIDINVVLSSQVFNEYYSVMLKNKAPNELIQTNIEAMILNFEIHWLSPHSVRRAFTIRTTTGYSWWDSLIIAAAIETGCATILTEDLATGHKIEGLTIANPFLENS